MKLIFLINLLYENKCVPFQVYQEGLRVKGILDEAKQSELIPPVLDALLDFHLNFLRQLNRKKLETEVVNSVAKIIYSEVRNMRFFLKIFSYCAEKIDDFHMLKL